MIETIKIQRSGTGVNCRAKACTQVMEEIHKLVFLITATNFSFKVASEASWISQLELVNSTSTPRLVDILGGEAVWRCEMFFTCSQHPVVTGVRMALTGDGGTDQSTDSHRQSSLRSAQTTTTSGRKIAYNQTYFMEVAVAACEFSPANIDLFN